MTDQHQPSGSRDRGVTPVVGAALLISITVLLAAVVATATLGLGSEAMQDPPQAGLSVSASPSTDEITIRHTGGDAVDASRTHLAVSVAGTEARFDAIATSTVLTVGSTAVMNTDGDDTVDWNGDGSIEPYEPDGGADVLPSLTDGDEVTVRLIDAESQVIFFETTVRA